MHILNAEVDADFRSVPMNTIIRTALRAHFQQSVPTDDCVCRACGRGGNTVGHWSRWCIVPLIVSCHLLKLPRIPSCLSQIAGNNDRNTAVCSLVIAQFRRLLRQEGAFLHQETCQAKSITWWVDELLVQVTGQAHLQLRLDRYMPPVIRACSLDHHNIRITRTVPISLQSLHQAPLQLVYPSRQLIRGIHLRVLILVAILQLPLSPLNSRILISNATVRL